MQLTRGGRVALGGAIAGIALAGAVAWWLARSPAPQGSAAKQPNGTVAGAPAGASPAVARAPASKPGAAPGRDSDPIGHAADLRAVHDRLRASANPDERRVARRAFATCVPAFLPPAGQPFSVDAIVRALPQAQRSEREAAWRGLYARCRPFGSEDRDALLQESADWRRDRASEDPGARALAEARSGRLQEAAFLVASVSPQDPAALNQLAGVASQVARRRDPDDRDLALRAIAVDTALPMVACDFGLACDAGSTRALQLCALQGACEGDVPARILARAGADQALAEAAQRERARLAEILRANGKLALGDLLP